MYRFSKLTHIQFHVLSCQGPKSPLPISSFLKVSGRAFQLQVVILLQVQKLQAPLALQEHRPETGVKEDLFLLVEI